MLSKSKLVLTVFVIFSIVSGIGIVHAADMPKTAISHSSTSFPYLAKPTSGNVNIRSGSGVAFYPCGKLGEDQTVTVVAEEFGWSKIVPPKGSFSWIAKKYIDIDKADNKVGIVNAEDVRVWVGSPDYDALTSSTTQLKLSKKNFDVVELLGQEDNDYLKIAPPSGAYLYVSSSQLKYVGPVGAMPDKKTKTPDPVKDPVKKVEPKKVEPLIKKKPPVDHTKDMYAKSTSRSPEVMKLIVSCRQIAEKAEAEREKPYDQQDYAELKKEVDKIAKDPNAEQAKEYAKYLMNLIDRYELVSIIDAELKKQELKRIEGLQAIEDKRLAAINAAKSKSSGKYVVKGVIEESTILDAGKKHYKILDKNNKFICYAVPVGNVPESTIEKYYSKKVALEGNIEKNSAGPYTLVKFTSIVAEDEE